MAIVNSRAAIEPKTGKAAIFVNETIHSLIRKLFANNEQGFAYDPNDLTTMFQDAAGTVPVTGAGQPVGLIRDKSGRGNHARQTVSASRPILQRNATTGAYYLEFDGVDDRLVTSSFPSMDLATSVFIGSQCSKTGTAAIAAKGAAGYIYQTAVRVTIQSLSNPVTVEVGGKTVITAKYAASGAGVTLKVNNLTSTNPATAERGFNKTNPLVIGAFDVDGAVPYLGRIYSLIGINRVTTDAETTALEKLIAKNTGVTLNV